jgi:DNA-binding CsgD family transcriptional regulator
MNFVYGVKRTNVKRPGGQTETVTHTDSGREGIVFDFILTALGANTGTCLFGYDNGTFLLEVFQGEMGFERAGLRPRLLDAAPPPARVLSVAPCETRRRDDRLHVEFEGKLLEVSGCAAGTCDVVCFAIDDGTRDILACSLSSERERLGAHVRHERLIALWQKTRDAVISVSPGRQLQLPAVTRAVLEAIPAPALLVRRDHTVVAHNDLAAREFTVGGLIGLTNHILTTSLRADAHPLSVAIADVLDDRPAATRTVLATEPATGLRRVLELRRFDLSRHGDENAEPTCMITILPNVSFSAAMRIAAAYGLSASERRLVARLAIGESIKEAAEAVGIKELSARTYMKRVFGKMGIRRQAQLISLLSSQGALLHCGPGPGEPDATDDADC